MTNRLRFSAAAAYRHLRRADPIMEPLIERYGPYRPRPSSDPYAALFRAILFQQLAGAAARAIMQRVLALYGEDGQTPSPHEVLSTTDADFRGAGLSRQKTAYLRDLAERMARGDLDFKTIGNASDAEVIERLTAVKGVGEWTAQMFLISHLGRPDVLPVGDLGVRKGMQVAYQLPNEPTPTEAAEIGAAWAPYRSVGSWYMWRILDTKTP